jgi:SAM-dependent methyltransferase
MAPRCGRAQDGPVEQDTGTPTPDPVSALRRLFDGLADDYDQSGVAFFGPIAERLTALLEVRPGEAALDVGCGRGAATLRLAGLVGPGGTVTAIDLAPAMVAHTRSAAQGAGLGHVTVREMDATRAGLPAGSYDVLASSLVLFFLPDPAAALRRWLRLLRPGGRIGVSTFGPMDAPLTALTDLFVPFHPPGMLDPRIDREDDPFGSDGAMERLVAAAGGRDVRTVTQPLPVVFDDVAQWHAWTRSTGQRMFWARMDPGQQAEVLARAAEILQDARTGDGRIVVHQEVRHTLARA